jgi:UDP-N-acetylmuramyl pentapeptide phosphotransferase/UDP-N-acetylglucosamine-1-phosphate transferase
MIEYQFLGVFFLAFGITWLCIRLNLAFFPWFKSREKKPWRYRFDGQHTLPAISTKLPNVGGISAAIGISIAIIIAHSFNVYKTDFRWFLVPIWVFTLVGFVDDVLKWRRAEGMRENVRLWLIVLASLATTAVLYYRLGYDQAVRPFNYISYFLLPAVWFIFFFIFNTSFTTVTVLSVGFSDGIDGLLGGLWFIASVTYSIVSWMTGAKIALAISSAMVGGSLAFLFFNFPSSWVAGRPISERKAKVYVGEAGAAFIGAAFSMISMLTLTELHWFIIGGVFVLEGVSALYQAKLATPLFRKFLKLPGFPEGSFVPHIDFPLPFMATPFHCHLDMIGMGRLKIVKMLYSLATVFGALGILILVWKEFAVKVGFYIIGMALMFLVWNLGSMFKTVFVAPYETTASGTRLGLFQGRPMQFRNFKFYWLREPLELTQEEIEPHLNMFSRMNLWHPLLLQDAEMMVAQLYYLAGKKEPSLAMFRRIPEKALRVRPEGWNIFTILSKELEGENNPASGAAATAASKNNGQDAYSCSANKVKAS